MSLFSTGTLIEKHGHVIGLNVIELFHAESFIAAAEKSAKPLVLQISENAVRYHGALEPLAAAVLAMAKSSSAELSVHLDHATDRKLISEALRLGFSSIMFDGSTLDYINNVSATQEVVREAKEFGAWVEAELGEIGGKDGVHAPGVRTKPSEAKEFAEATGIHGLAVAVGSSHAMKEKSAVLDLGLIGEIAAEVSVPLVLHGSSGVSVEQIGQAVKAGIRKVNIATEFNVVLTQSIKDYFVENNSVVDPRKYIGAARVKMQELAQMYLERI